MAIAADEDAHGASEEGENYFVSMTDMMVGVLFIFIIMLMVFALDFKTKAVETAQVTHEQREAIERQKRALEEAQKVARRVGELQAEVNREIGALDQAAAVRRQLVEDIAKRLKDARIDVTLSPKSDVLRLTEKAINFPLGVSTPTQDTKTNVPVIARIVREVLNDYVACRSVVGERRCAASDRPKVETIFVEGHTDVRGDDRSNWTLSTGRAATVYQEFIAAAPELRTYFNRDGQEVLSVSGYSSTRPVDPSPTEQAYATNRRIDLRFVMENDSRQRFQGLKERTETVKDELEALIRVIGAPPP
jgi:flagellar motor protein MotB